MPRVGFDSLPANARLWVFAAERPLDVQERERLLTLVDGFLDQWKAHGVPLAAARDWRYDRFLLIGVDESAAGASGCSIDAMVHQLATLERSLGVELLDHGPVLFRRADRIERLPRPAFNDLARRGDVSSDTIVFNNTVTRVGDVREGRWETRASASWHSRVFNLQT
jgi:hypothetical protein